MDRRCTGRGTEPAFGVITIDRDTPGRADFYWAEDIGLVFEEHRDVETGEIILSKSLQSVTGL